MWYDSIPTVSIVRLNSTHYYNHGCLVEEDENNFTIYGFVYYNLTINQLLNINIDEQSGVFERPAFTINNNIVKLAYADEECDEEGDVIELDNPNIFKRSNSDAFDLKIVKYKDLLQLSEQNVKLYADMNGNGIDEISSMSQLENGTIKQQVEAFIIDEMIWNDDGIDGNAGFWSGDNVLVSKADYIV
mgnify:CR=1 FL=1